MPSTLSENLILWILPAIIFVVAVANGVRAWLGYREVRADADREYSYRQKRGMVDGRLTESGFRDAFVRAHAPRAALWTAIGMGAVLLLTLPVFRLMDVVMNLVWRLSGENRTFEPTFLVYQFGIFFGVLALWAAIGFFAARAYHRGASVSFEDELRRELGERV